MVKAFGIFEGGGAKGLAHVGALQAAEENKVQFIGLAGASAGAIVASLVAAGYQPNELFDPDSQIDNCIFDENFVLLLGRKRWYFISKFRKFLSFLRANLLFSIFFVFIILIFIVALIFIILVGFAYLFSWMPFLAIGLTITIIIIIIIVSILINITLPLGLFSSKNFEIWLNEKLRIKVFPMEPERIVTFEDVKVPLKIIATDVKSKKPVVFSDENHQTFSVAKAVSYSIAIPGAFRPHFTEEMVLVDGGVLSNFPAWVFDQQRKEQKEIVSTIGFRLHSDLPSFSARNIKNSIYKHILDLSTVFFGDNILEIREIEDLHLIPIKVSAHTLDFDLNKTGRKHLYYEGYHAAKKFFQNFSGPKNSAKIKLFLKTLHQEMIKLIKKPKVHLRINIALPVEPSKQKLRILYSYNMDNDTDDRLELSINGGAIGKCWQTLNPVLVDMEQAKKTFETDWRMNKYQQALVRPTLKTLISMPIFDPISLDTYKNGDKNVILAVLSMDSDHDLLNEFTELSRKASGEIRELVDLFSSYIAEELRN